MSMTILDMNYGLGYIDFEKWRYVVHNGKIYLISRHWSQPWLSWSRRRRRNLSCRISRALSKGCVITMNFFRLVCLHFCRSAEIFWSWQGTLSQVCLSRFCTRKYRQNYVKNLSKIQCYKLKILTSMIKRRKKWKDHWTLTLKHLSKQSVAWHFQ